MPPPTFSPRIRVILTRQLGGKRDEGTGTGGASRSVSFTVHGVESEEWIARAFLDYLRYLKANGFPEIEIKQNQTSRNTQDPLPSSSSETP